MKIAKFLFIPLILAYQCIISPLVPSFCRFTPSCSQYMLESIKAFGVIKGGYLGIKRLLKCRPGGGRGFDPVPKKNEY